MLKKQNCKKNPKKPGKKTKCMQMALAHANVKGNLYLFKASKDSLQTF